MKENAYKKLEEYSQEHLINIIEKFEKDKQEKIINEILELDFEEIKELYQVLKDGQIVDSTDIKPIDYVDKNSLTTEEIERYSQKGLEILKNKQFAVVTMAGGQGSRLGHNGPKGTYVVDVLPKPMSIFEILSQKFIRAEKKYGVIIPWYVMTGSQNHNQTVEFFEENNYFGLNKDKVSFFKQGDIAVIDENGKLMIDDTYLIKKAGNGNGGIYKALQKEKVLEDLKNNGVKWVLVSGVDNILANIIDPVFLGINLEKGTQIASKSSPKKYAEEKVGVFCKRNGKPGTVEYTETSEEMRNSKNEKGDFLYGQSNIISHLYSVEALDMLKDQKLEYHIAHKKGAYLNENLELIKPESENMYKFEMFIFDAFQYFDDMTVFSVNREDEFAPIKNATGNDSPETASKLYNVKEEEGCKM